MALPVLVANAAKLSVPAFRAIASRLAARGITVPTPAALADMVRRWGPNNSQVLAIAVWEAAQAGVDLLDGVSLDAIPDLREAYEHLQEMQADEDQHLSEVTGDGDEGTMEDKMTFHDALLYDRRQQAHYDAAAAAMGGSARLDALYSSLFHLDADWMRAQGHVRDPQ
jgi:hypothetical protein